ncbi:hypothetical protein Dxin01_00100 [Deinococcus xinjiangensis]|uniref:Uncharacterized protein n=1 Tax=Deinococcus xinjiangensis TaxID=457454 RepID=A0ABP9V515_9DEIO
MKLQLRLIDVQLFRGSPLEGTEKVVAEDFYEYQDLKAAFESGALHVRLMHFLSAHGYPSVDPRPTKIISTPNGAYLILQVNQTPDRFTYLQASPVAPEPQEPSPTAQVAAAKSGTDQQVARTFKKWRSKLDGLKKARAELEAKPSRSAEEDLKLQQVIGAVNVLSGVLSDLQLVRPVNQSVLNV